MAMNLLRSAAAAKHISISMVESRTSLKELKQIHSHLLVSGHLSDPHFLGQFAANIALNNPGNLNYSDQLLNQCENPSLSAINAMIRAHSKGSSPHKSFHFFNRILWSPNLSPDNYTFNFLVRASAQLLANRTGRAVHGALLKHGFEFDPHIQCGLVFMYSELGCLGFCRQVFESIPHPGLVCQTAMVSAFAKCGEIEYARELFDLMPERDHVAWTAMVAGYSQCGQSREALQLFHLMQLECVKINEICMVSVLSACSHLGALDHGRWAHAYIERNHISVTVTLGTALIDMYAKCGDMNKEMEVFWGMKVKNVYTWSSAMNGLAMNGAGAKCLELFSLMKKDGVLPNDVTFLSVLRACCVVGSIDKGREHFDAMKTDYGIEPRAEHYGCLIDLYARAGHLSEALNIINSMPMEPHAGAWAALLNASKLYDSIEMGELASRKLIELEGNNPSAYVLLSNIYADHKNWDSVANVRLAMKATGVRKSPGCSVIEVDGEVHEFLGGNISHPRYDEILTILAEVTRMSKLSIYVAKTVPLLFDIEEEDVLCY